MINTLPRGVYAYLVELPIVAYQQFGGADFPIFFYVQFWRTKRFSKLFEASTPGFCEIWKLLASYVEEKVSL